MTHTTHALFAECSALAGAIQGYQLRPGQQQLAGAIADSLSQEDILVAEAGTGIGKTFAYLIPVLSNHRKTLISTATKNLQEQIFTHDLPLARQALSATASVALLKGRRNYFCHHHFTQLEQEVPADKEEHLARQHIRDFMAHTRDGDLAGLTKIAEDSPLLEAITSTAENCLGRDCDFFEQCFVQQARQKAKEADIVIVNHHLLLADFSLKSEGFAEILPDVTAFVIDEAHHLPQTAIRFLGKHLSYRQLGTWCNDSEAAILTEAPDALEARHAVRQIRKASQDVLLSLAPYGEVQLDGEALTALTDFWTALKQLDTNITTAQQILAVQQERGKLLANIYQRLNKIHETLQCFTHSANDASRHAIKTDVIPTATYEACWLDSHPRGFILSTAPVNAAGRFVDWIHQSRAGWVFLSATLTVGGTFTHFLRELGLPAETQTLRIDSPFNYRQQAVLYHPHHLPSPSSQNYTDLVIKTALPLLKLSRGRAFLLFTSYRALHTAKILLQKTTFKLFIQGDAPRARLLDEFRQTPNAVLLGTASFWEGVDVRGQALVCVVIDKLPFAAPSDPITRTRHQLLRAQGLAPFIHDSLPQAVITLKQGVGRLIRDSKDYGVLMIADPRLTSKSYGKVFLDSLPRMTRTSQFAIVERFFNHHECHDA